MIVVFDTNIWKSELYLQSPAAAATRFFLRQKKAQVALPEVIRLEVEAHFKIDMLELLQRIKNDHGRLLKVFGTLRELVLPEQSAILDFPKQLFESVGVPIVEIPFSLESARSSFLKVVYKLAPSNSRQQFKDGVLWADCARLLKESDVWLVTSDKAFYEGGEFKDGLAKSLAAEIAEAGHNIYLRQSLSSLLDEVRHEVDVDMQLLSEALLQKDRERINGLAERNGFAIGEVVLSQRKLFVTEKPTQLFVEFSFELVCPDLSENRRESATLTVKGDAMYDSEKREFRDIRNFSEELKFRLPDGTQKEFKNVGLFAEGIFLGHKEISNTIRYELDQVRN